MQELHEEINCFNEELDTKVVTLVTMHALVHTRMSAFHPSSANHYYVADSLLKQSEAFLASARTALERGQTTANRLADIALQLLESARKIVIEWKR